MGYFSKIDCCCNHNLIEEHLKDGRDFDDRLSLAYPQKNIMIRLWSRKEEQKNEGSRPKKASAAVLRVQKDLNELDLPPSCQIEHPNPDDLLTFKVTIKPDSGYYRGGRFVFNFRIGPEYPHEAPKVKCEQRIYHPNIDLEGNVCLNILRQDWKPVLTINSVIHGLSFLFLEPNPEDPLNKEAAEVLQTNKRLFEQNVQRAMRGVHVESITYDRVL